MQYPVPWLFFTNNIPECGFPLGYSSDMFRPDMRIDEWHLEIIHAFIKSSSACQFQPIAAFQFLLLGISMSLGCCLIYLHCRGPNHGKDVGKICASCLVDGLVWDVQMFKQSWSERIHSSIQRLCSFNSRSLAFHWLHSMPEFASSTCQGIVNWISMQLPLQKGRTKSSRRLVEWGNEITKRIQNCFLYSFTSFCLAERSPFFFGNY